MTAVFITPLPSEREFKGTEVQCGEKEEDWSEERSNYSKLKHGFLIKKKVPRYRKILSGERNCGILKCY